MNIDALLPEQLSQYVIFGVVAFNVCMGLWVYTAFKPWQQAVIDELLMINGKRTEAEIIDAHPNCATRLPWRKKYYHEFVRFTVPYDSGGDSGVDDGGADDDDNAGTGATDSVGSADSVDGNTDDSAYSAEDATSREIETWSDRHATWSASTVTRNRVGERVEIAYNEDEPEICIVLNDEGKVALKQIIGGFFFALAVLMVVAIAYITVGFMHYM